MRFTISTPAKISIFVLLFFAAASALTVRVAPGDLDAGFGSGGVVVSPIGKVSPDRAFAAALQADGKIVVAGDSVDGSNLTESTSLVVTRVNADGSLDTSFGAGGRVIKRLPYVNRANAVVIQPDGKIVAGGYSLQIVSGTPKYHFLLVGFNPNGSIDATFGANGVVTTTFSASDDNNCTALALQTDGKIVAAGYTSFDGINAPFSMFVVRYNADGSLDASFDGDGKLTVNITSSGNRANAVAIQTDGKIVLGGFAGEGNARSFALARLNMNGSLDATFDGDGKLTTPIGTSRIGINALKIQSDGKIVAAGNPSANSNRDFMLARYNADGSLDASFDTDGIVTTNFVGDDAATGIGIQADGKIVVGGYARLSAIPFSPYGFLAARYNADGSLDTSFNGNGFVITQPADFLNQAYAVLIQPDGKIVAAGFCSIIVDASITLIRHNANGSLDAAFDGDGIALIELGNSSDYAVKTAIQTDGKIVAAGSSYKGFIREIAMARYHANGSPDASFGVQGVVTTSLGLQADGAATDVAIQPDGKIVITASSVEEPKYTLLRYNTDGSLDASFGAGGIAIVQVGTSGDTANCLALQSDGKIIAAGSSSNGATTPGGNSLIRLNPDGSLDASFGNGGKIIIPDSPFSYAISSIAVQPDGKILTTSYNSSFGSTSSAMFHIFRLNTNGSFDTSFGTSGIVRTSFEMQGDANSIAVQPNGKIVVAGSGYQSYALARYNPDGSLDTSFDGDGKVSTPYQTNRFGIIRDLAVQQNGKIITAGIRFNGVDDDAVIFRYNADGSPDSSFGNAGKVIAAIGEGNNYFNGLSLQADGKIVAAGFSSNGANDDFTIARFLGDAAAPARTRFDFDGDGKADVSVFRPDNGAWYLQQSTSGFTGLLFGISTDRIVPADYDGDGKTDVAVYRDGTWYLQRSQLGFGGFVFGTAADIPVPADFDGDGRAELAVFRPSNGGWYLYNLTTGQASSFAFGLSGDVPVPADYDGDGRADLAVFRGGVWYIQRSELGFTGIQFGLGGDKPVPADYDGDGKTDVAVFRDGTWYLLRSTFGFTGISFGLAADLAVPADYDGDGKADVAVFRSGIWYLNRSTQGFTGVQFGTATDKPIPNAFIP